MIWQLEAFAEGKLGIEAILAEFSGRIVDGGLLSGAGSEQNNTGAGTILRSIPALRPDFPQTLPAHLSTPLQYFQIANTKMI